MASSVSAPVVVSQATKRTHSEMSSSDLSGQHNQTKQFSLQADVTSSCASMTASKTAEPKHLLESRASTGNAVCKLPASDPVEVTPNASNVLHPKETATSTSLATPNSDDTEKVNQSQKPCNDATKATSETATSTSVGGSPPVETKALSNGASNESSSTLSTLSVKEIKKAADTASETPAKHASVPTAQLISESNMKNITGPETSAPESVNTSTSAESQDATDKANMESAASRVKSGANKMSANSKTSSKKSTLEFGEEPEKKPKVVSSSSKGGGRTADQILEYMDKTFEHRRKIITKQMPSIPELKELYPDLFMGKQLLLEFQRITKIDIDQKIQEFCVRYATAVIEMAENKKEAAPVLARWEQAKLENDTLKQYWDMVTALCLLPLHFGENFVEMVLEIGEDEEVVAQGKIVPTLVARGNIFRTDEFFLIAENTIVQEFEEFTIAFASLYSSYWVFNMVYPETIESTYNYIQRCIVRQREPGSIPLECKNFTKALLKWNKGKEGK